jgi:phosphorylase kinase alpha/beta subunit
MLVVNNKKLLPLIRGRHDEAGIREISDFLTARGTFNFSPLPNGLFPAAVLGTETEYTGYANVWVRDNIFVAYSHYFTGSVDAAARTLKCLTAYFKKHRRRFDGIIEGTVGPENIMARPHIRFDGRSLEEIDQEWNHAQNDALGYYLWLYCILAREEVLKPRSDDLKILALFPLHFQAIRYWEDEDSGHWEEDRKIEASSIGAVIAGLTQLKMLLADPRRSSLCTYKGKPVTAGFLDELIARGTASLNDILPSECIQPYPRRRRYDAALLFLIHPLHVVEGEMADRILEDVVENLQGDYGIRRYTGDSFWCRDYKDIPEEIRTDVSGGREQWFMEHGRELKKGEEAQWCIFDPIVSAVFGLKFQETRREEYLERQTRHLNRSLGQITGEGCPLGEFRCPELYYLQKGHYVPNDATPLLWTQANLKVALKMMELSLR